MNKLNDTYITVDFVELDSIMSLERRRDGSAVRLGSRQIIELAAVKVQNCRLVEHYSSFVAIDGVDMEEMDFSSYDFLRGLTPQHLLGAPCFKTVAECFLHFVDDGTIVTTTYMVSEMFADFKSMAAKFGVILNNPVIKLYDLVQAKYIKDIAADCDLLDEDIFSLAEKLKMCGNMRQVMVDFNTFYDPDCSDITMRSRVDPLSSALAHAQLLAALLKSQMLRETPSADCPF